MVAIFVVLTIVAFVLIDAAVQRKEVRQPVGAGEAAFETAVVAPIEERAVPRGLFVAPSHTWVALQPSGNARVGMDHFAQQAIGRIDTVELPPIGKTLRQGDTLFVIRQGKRQAAFRSPLEGVVEAVNRDLEASAAALCSDPYETGWVCSLNPRNLAQSIRRLSLAEEASAWLKRELGRFREFVLSRSLSSVAAGAVLQDGGHMINGVLEQMTDSAWESFGTEFLGNKE